MWISWIILYPQDFSCQVSSLGSHFCSVNWSIYLKSAILGKKSIVANLQSNLIICDPHQHYGSYEPFDQVWSTTPQEIWSDHQKGKMVIFRILTAEVQFLIFNLANGKLGSSMYSSAQWHHLDIITMFKRSQMHWIDRWISQSTDQILTVHWKVKLWLFGQN